MEQIRSPKKLIRWFVMITELNVDLLLSFIVCNTKLLSLHGWSVVIIKFSVFETTLCHLCCCALYCCSLVYGLYT